MDITLQRVNRSSSRLVLGWGFQGWRIERRHIRLGQIEDGGRWPFWKTSNGHISATCHPIKFVFGSTLGFRQGRIELWYFGFAEIHDGSRRPFRKIQMTISLEVIIRFTWCMHTDHTLPSDSMMTVDAWNTNPVTDRRSDIYFVREDIKRKNEKVDLGSLCEEYTLDLSQSKVFLVGLTFTSHSHIHINFHMTKLLCGCNIVPYYFNA